MRYDDATLVPGRIVKGAVAYAIPEDLDVRTATVEWRRTYDEGTLGVRWS